jgi:hypothetical protein
LYRSSLYPQHWLVWNESGDWNQFPAKINGWGERRAVNGVDRRHLRQVPLRMAFRTGLLESLERQRVRKAA